MAQKNTISISIGAALKSSFGTALGGGRKQLSQMGNAIKKLETDSKRLTGFQKMKTDVNAAKRSWEAAEEQVKQLSVAMKKVEKPTAKMQREFTKAKNAAKRAKDAFTKKQAALQGLRGEMKAAGQNTRNLTAQQAKLGASVDRLRGKYTALDQAMKRGEGIKARRANMRGQMLDMVALGAAIGAPLKAAIDFESEMADVRKVVDFKDGKKGLKNFGNELKAMSRTIPISAAGLANIAAAGGQLGVDEEALPGFVKTASQMAVAFDILPGEAGKSMAKLSNIFGIPITEMSKLGDAMNHLSDNTAASASEIIEAITRSGAQASDFGLSAEQTAALADTFIAMGKRPQVAATAMNALLLKLNTADKQSAKFQSGLSALGIEATELKDAIKNDAQGALESFLETVSKVEQQERAGILSDLFGLEYADDISLLAGKVDLYKKTVRLLGDEKKHLSMQREFENRSNTTANSLQLLSNQMTEIGMNIGSTLLPPLNFLVNNLLRPMSGIVADLAERFPILTGVVFGVTFALIGLKIAAIGLGYAWTFVLGGANALVVGFRGLQAALAFANVQFKALNITTLITSVRLKALAFGGMVKAFATGLMTLASRAIPIVIGALRGLTIALLTNPITLVVTAIAGLATLVFLKWDKVKELFSSFWEKIKPAWETFFGWIKTAWEVISNPLTTIGKIWDSIFGGGSSVDATVTTKEEVGELQKSLKDAAITTTQAPEEHKTFHNDFKITVQAAPGQDVNAIANEVMRRIREQSRGALFDTQGAVL